jgi:cell shape-determining protein MreD
MIAEIAKNIFRILLFILIQVSILKHFELGNYINPFLYVIAILMLPINMNKGWVMIAAFFIGLIVDMFYNTMGINAAACVFMAFCRPWVLSIYAPKGEYETTARPTMQSLGLPWLISYAGTLVLLHHLILFYAERLSFSSFFSTFAEVILSSIATVVLIVLSQALMQRNTSR